MYFAFNSSFSKLIDVWQSSNTYGHGFLILPIVLWLINRNKHLLAKIDTQPSLVGLFFVGLTSFFWFISALSYINVIEQFAIFSLFVVLTWVFFGWKMVVFLKFPLAFLYFSIPVGDFLVPYLQFITADISVFMIKAFGIPVFRDGMYIQIPNGNFLVAEACSGIRFLISTVTIGVLYSYLNFSKFYKQILFVLLCCIVSIVGNGLRAFLMILIGHLSNMQAAVGFDHFVYGGVFFCIILAVLFVIGYYMADPLDEIEKPVSTSDKQISQQFPSFVFIVITFSFLLIGPLLKYKYENHVAILAPQQINKLTDHSPTKLMSIPKFNHNWMPSFPDSDETYISSLTSPTSTNNIDIFVAKYHYETNDKEIISYKNRLFNVDFWSINSISTHEITIINDEKVPYNSFSIVNMRGEERKLRVVYKVNGILVANKIQFKLFQLINKIMMTDFGGEVIVLSSTNKHEADIHLDAFMYQNFFKIKQYTTLVK
jgi:exosortase A